MKYLLRKSIAVPLAAVMLVFALVVWMGLGAIDQLLRSRDQIEKAHEFLGSLETILAMATDEETGQRGFILTGEDQYLEPYSTARQNIDGELGRARKLAEFGPYRRIDLAALVALFNERTALLEQQIQLRRDEGLVSAVEAVKDGRAKVAMDRIRQEIKGLDKAGKSLLAQGRLDADRALKGAVLVGTVGIGVCTLLFAFVFYRIGREMRQRDAAENALREVRDDLEVRVTERTAELRTAEEQARLAREKAETANEAKSEFLSRVSHELRTPLNAILGFGQLMEMGGRLPAEQISNLHHIMRGGRHLLDLVDELLDLTAVEAGRLAMSLEPVQLQDAVVEAVSMIAAQARSRSVHIKVHSFPLSDVHVLADRHRVMQVFLNLFSNAVKFNRFDGAVDITCEIIGESRLRLNVRDTGCGIAASDLEKLFAPFERVGISAAAAEGTGLGLILSKRLIMAMSGTMGVVSVLGEGSTFWVELVRVEAPPVPPPAAAGPAANVSYGGAGKTVLYIEDNLANLKLIEHVLRERPGVTLISSMQGSLGLDLAFGKRPDLILLDLHLPDISGKEVLRRLRIEPATRETPVIILTADATPHRLERILNAGAQACVSKPIDVRAFLDLLDRTLEGESLDQPAS